MKSIRVLLADDHKLIRAGLRLVVDQQPDLSVVGEADDGRQAVELAKSLKPDGVVMDSGGDNSLYSDFCVDKTHSHAKLAYEVCDRWRT